MLDDISKHGTTPTVLVWCHADVVITVEEATESFLKKIERLAPFGMQNSKPVFLFRDVVIHEISHFGKGKEHLKLKIGSAESGRALDAVTFFAKGAMMRTIEKCAPGSQVHLLAHIERDTFSRGNPVRLRLLAIKNAG